MTHHDLIPWRGRKAVRIANDQVELTVLLGGGHFAVFRYLSSSKELSQNVLWEAQWKTCEPDETWSNKKTLLYGDPIEGRFLSGYSGHALCLDYFGLPTQIDADAGLSLHGEAAITQWNSSASGDLCILTVDLPRSKLSLKRTIRMCAGESVVTIEESAFNQTSIGHVCDWVQHVTFGHPFLCKETGILAASGREGLLDITPKRRPPFPAEPDFVWPTIPQRDADLRSPFSMKGQTILAGVRLDPDRDIQFVLAYNKLLGLGVGYCFRRKDFPWLTVWEENCGRTAVPWNGRTRARGMEFGTNPLPLGRLLRADSQFGTQIGCVIPANGSRESRYLMFLFATRPGALVPTNVEVKQEGLALYDENGKTAAEVPSSQCAAFLSP